MVSVHSDVDNSAVAEVCPDGGCWLGLHCYGSSHGQWSWTDGTPVNYNNWGSSEPNDAGGTEDCVAFKSTGKWNDLSCEPYTKRAVCYHGTVHRPQPTTCLTSSNQLLF